METVRYLLALSLLICTPPALLVWFFIHPSVRFWRKLGVRRSYLVLGSGILLGMAALFRLRQSWLATEYGTRAPLVLLGLLLLAGSTWIKSKRSKYLTWPILAGFPEIAPARHGSRLLDEGIYARIRHPRYLEFLLALAGCALIADYLALYLVVLASIPLLFLVVWLEERELRHRFGREYESYCRRVPRFIPHFTR